MSISEIAAARSSLNFRRPRIGHFPRASSPSQNWVLMIVGCTEPEIYALRLYSIEIKGFHFVSSQVIEGWNSAEFQCFVPCCLWKWGFHTSRKSSRLLHGRNYLLGFFNSTSDENISAFVVIWDTMQRNKTVGLGSKCALLGSNFVSGKQETVCGARKSILNDFFRWGVYWRELEF
jgi:hypothetical protein